MEAKIDIQKLLEKLQAQLGAQLVRISMLEIEIERLQSAAPKAPTKTVNENKEKK